MKNNSLVKSSMNAGAILGLVMVAFTIVLYVLNLTTSKSLNLLFYVFIVAGLYISIKQYGKEQLNGFLTYKVSLSYGILVSFFASVILAFFTYLLYKLIDPDLINKLKELQIEEMLKRGITEDQIEYMQDSSIFKMMLSPGMIAISSLFTYTIVGVLLSLIVSFFTKSKQPNGFDQAMNEIN